MFVSIYEKEFSQYYELRSAVLRDSARKHELCYLKRFDKYIADNIQTDENVLSESFLCKWISTLHGSSSSIENEVIVIRQFLKYLIYSFALSGRYVLPELYPVFRNCFIKAFKKPCDRLAALCRRFHFLTASGAESAVIICFKITVYTNHFIILLSLYFGGLVFKTSSKLDLLNAVTQRVERIIHNQAKQLS